jgi:ribonuclease M5
MKNRLKPVIVVEGASDVNKLSLLVDADFVVTNGSEVSRETLSYLKELSLSRQIIILTDPDYPGMRIRNIINQEIEGCFNAFVSKEKSIKKHKVGVAECDAEEILKAISNVVQFHKYKKQENLLTTSDLFELNLYGKNVTEKRNFIADYYHIGKVNSKTFIKRLNMLQVTKEEIKEVLKSYENCK